MASPKRHVQVDGDTRDGALFAESASRYVGTRRIAGGRFEERVFSGMPKWQAKAEWREWRDETVKRETIHVESGGMGARHYSVDRPIAGNTSEGRLYSTNVNGHYVGERRTRDGKLETRNFDMPKAEAKTEWRRWRAELTQDDDAVDDAAQDVHEEDEVAAKSQQPKGKETIYVLTFRANRTQKSIAAYHDMESALRMAESLGVALDVAGVEGEYDVSDVEVWG